MSTPRTRRTLCTVSPYLRQCTPPGVLADVAADGARDLRRRIRRVIETVGRRGDGNREIGHARLHDGGLGQGVDRHDAAELRHRDHDAPLVRQRAAGQARPRAARDDGHAGRVAAPQHLDQLGFVIGNRDRRRQLAVHRQAVALVRPRLLGRREQRRRRQDGRELGVDGGIEHQGRIRAAGIGRAVGARLPAPSIIPHRRPQGTATGASPQGPFRSMAIRSGAVCLESGASGALRRGIIATSPNQENTMRTSRFLCGLAIAACAALALPAASRRRR